MKILCFHPALAPYRVDFFNLLGRFSDLKIIFLQKNLQNQRFNQFSLLSMLHVPYEYLTSGIMLFGRCIRTGILRTVRRERPDIILAYEGSFVTLELLVLKRLCLIKADVWTSMDDSPDQIRGRTGIRRVIRNFVMRNVTRIIVPSEAAQQAYRGVLPSVSQKRYSVVPIIHDTKAMRKNAAMVYENGRAWRLANCPKEWSRIIVFVGRFAEVKNLPWLIERMAELPKTTGLVLVGDGPLQDALRKKVSEMGLSGRVLFAGRKEGDELYSIIAVSDVLALASTSETFGAVVAEGLAWGTPCLVSDRCGAASLIEDGYNGCVFKCNDPTSFKKAIMQLPQRTDHSILRANLEDAVKHLIFS